MKLTVRLFAVLRERAGTGELSLDDLPEPLDVAGLKRALEARHPELGSLAQVAGVVGTRYVRDDTRLAQGDAVALLPPVSGGAPGEDEALAQGLFAWDAGWYRALAELGYTGNHESALRFFPLLPALSRGLGFVFLGHEDVAVIVIANVGALVLAALVHRLALVDTGDERLAVRAAWFVLLHVVLVPVFSAAPPKRFLPDWNLACLLAHVVLIGIPAAWMARRWYGGVR